MAVLVPDTTVDVFFNAKKIPEVIDSFFINKPFHRIIWNRKQLNFSSKQLETFRIDNASSPGGWIAEDGTIAQVFTDPINKTSYDPKLYMDIFTNTGVEQIFNQNNPDAVLNSLNEKFKVFMKQIEDRFNDQLWSRTAAGQTSAEFKWNNVENFMSKTTVVGAITPTSTNRWKANVLDALTDFGSSGDPADPNDLADPTKDVYIPDMLDKLIAQNDFKNDMGKTDILVTTAFIFNLTAQIIEHQKLGTELGRSRMGKLLAEMGARFIEYKGIPMIVDEGITANQTTDNDGRIYGFTLGIPNANQEITVAGVQLDVDDNEGAGLYYTFNAGAVMRMLRPIEPGNQWTVSLRNVTVGNIVSPDRNSMGMITNIRSPQNYSDGTV